MDTSIWIDHLRKADAKLAALLNVGEVCTHPFVIGEIALGRLSNRKLILRLLGDLPQAVVASDAEVLHFIDRNEIDGWGIGYIDAHLLASTMLTPGLQFATKDRRLAETAVRLGIARTI